MTFDALFQQFEVLLMCKLKGDLCAVTGFDYVDHVLERLTWPGDKALVRRHARTLVDLCYTGESESGSCNITSIVFL